MESRQDPKHAKASTLAFTSLEGKEGKDPHDAIHGKRADSYVGTIDYLAIDATNNIGICELWGRRNTQEDRVLAGNCSSVADLSSEDWKGALKETVASLEEKVEKDLARQAREQGSCLIANVMVGTTIYTANVGDSTAFVLVLDNAGKATVTALNTKLHNPSEKSEKQRIETSGGEVIDVYGVPRLNGSLAISRAIGDTIHNKHGISHEADVYANTITIPEGGSAFVITACDGLTESNYITAKKISDIVSQHKGKKPQEIAKALAEAAFKAGSQDNISVIVTPIDASSKTPKYVAVFDGHGGDAVSEHLYQHFNDALDKKLEEKLLLRASSALEEDPFADTQLNEIFKLSPQEEALFTPEASPVIEADKETPSPLQGLKLSDEVRERIHEFNELISPIYAALISGRISREKNQEVSDFLNEISALRRNFLHAAIIDPSAEKLDDMMQKFRYMTSFNKIIPEKIEKPDLEDLDSNKEIYQLNQNLAGMATRSSTKKSENNQILASLLTGVISKNKAYIELLLADTTINFMQVIDTSNSDTLLHRVMRQDIDGSILQQLLSHPAAMPAVNALNDQNETPLHLAIKRNHQVAALALVQNGANPTLRNSNRKTALNLITDEAFKTRLLKAREGFENKQAVSGEKPEPEMKTPVSDDPFASVILKSPVHDPYSAPMQMETEGSKKQGKTVDELIQLIEQKLPLVIRNLEEAIKVDMRNKKPIETHLLVIGNQLKTLENKPPEELYIDAMYKKINEIEYIQVSGLSRVKNQEALTLLQEKEKELKRIIRTIKKNRQPIQEDDIKSSKFAPTSESNIASNKTAASSAAASKTRGDKTMASPRTPKQTEVKKDTDTISSSETKTAKSETQKRSFTDQDLENLIAELESEGEPLEEKVEKKTSTVDKKQRVDKALGELDELESLLSPEEPTEEMVRKQEIASAIAQAEAELKIRTAKVEALEKQLAEAELESKPEKTAAEEASQNQEFESESEDDVIISDSESEDDVIIPEDKEDFLREKLATAKEKQASAEDELRNARAQAVAADAKKADADQAKPVQLSAEEQADKNELEKKINKHVNENLKHYLKRTEYFKSMANIVCDREDLGAQRKLRTSSEALKKQLEIYREHLKNPESDNGLFARLKSIFKPVDVKAELAKVNECLKNVDDTLTTINEKSQEARIGYFSRDSKVVIKRGNEPLEDAINRTIKELCGVSAGKFTQHGGIAAGPTEKTTEQFRDTARVNYSMIGNVHCISTQRLKDKSTYVSEFGFHAANEKATLDTSKQGFPGRRIPNDDLLKWAVAEVQNFMAGNPDNSRPIRIVGNMPEACVEAIMLYCKHRGCAYTNETPHKINLSSGQLKAYEKKLAEHPERFLDIDRQKDEKGALSRGKHIKQMESKTTAPVPPPSPKAGG